MKILNIMPLSLLFAGLVSCSSSLPTQEKIEVVEHKDIETDYVIREVSQTVRPGWVQNAQTWAEENKKDVERFRFYSYQTGIKVDQETACQLAQVQAKADLAGEISSFIIKTMAVSTEGQTNLSETSSASNALQEYVENNLAEKVQGFLNGARIEGTYWEKRRYLQARGASRDYTAFTCAVLIRIENQYIKDAIDNAVNAITKKASTPELKVKVENALKEISKVYLEQTAAPVTAPEITPPISETKTLPLPE